jgi:Na+-driven multidrug efflux pump
MASTVITPITTGFITYQVAQFGQEAVAGYGVASRVEGLILLVFMALSAGVAPFIGQNFGAQKFERVKNGFRWCYRFSLVYGSIAALLMAISCTIIAGWFTDNDIAISTAKLHMRIVPVSYLALGIAMTATSSFNAIGNPVPGMFVSLTRTILLYAPLAFLLANLFGLVGVFAAACIANVSAGGIGFVWFRKVLAQYDKDTVIAQKANA